MEVAIVRVQTCMRTKNPPLDHASFGGNALKTIFIFNAIDGIMHACEKTTHHSHPPGHVSPGDDRLRKRGLGPPGLRHVRRRPAGVGVAGAHAGRRGRAFRGDGHDFHLGLAGVVR